MKFNNLYLNDVGIRNGDYLYLYDISGDLLDVLKISESSSSSSSSSSSDVVDEFLEFFDSETPFSVESVIRF